MPLVRLIAATVFVICLGAWGCNRGPTMVAVEGVVTLDSQPIKEGIIRFVPKNSAAGNPGEAIIKDGKYSVSVVATEHAVEIRAPRPIPNAPARAVAGPGAEGVAMEESVPAKFNDATELKADVSATSNKHDFALSTK